MPELPEVEVIRQEMQVIVKGKIIKKADIIFPGSLGYPSPEVFYEEIKGKKIKDIQRKGKFLIFSMTGSFRLVVHLRMTGSLFYTETISTCNLQKHLRLIIYFRDGGAVYFSDPRKFGRIWLLGEAEDHYAGLQRLGPDWLEDATLDIFKSQLKNRLKTPVKKLLLDQSFFAGLGNIYIDESLFRARIHPATRMGFLSEIQVVNLFKIIKEVLAEGIAAGGTTVRDYRNASGAPGGFQNRILVYGKKGKPCPHCGMLIERTVLCGRGTHFCPGCQSCVDSAED